jgi:glycosyltransferase involved in cell wall biosynthesis
VAGLDVTIGVFENIQNPNFELANAAKKKGFEVQIFPCKGKFDKKTVYMIKDFLHTSGVNILHSHNYKSNFYSWMVLPFNGVRWVVTNHGRRIGTKLLLYNFIDMFIVRRADRIVAVSEMIARGLKTCGIEKEKIAIIDNGINIERMREARAHSALKQSLGIEPEARAIGTVGSLTKEKGHEYLLRAACMVLDSYPRTVFLLVGAGRERHRLESLACQLGIEKNVIFPGVREDIPQILSILDVFVLPSLMEGLPMALLEAQAAGIPTVATRVGAIPKVIQDGITGILVQPGDFRGIAKAIAWALSDRAEACEMARRGRERVRANFSSQKMTESYLDLYEGLLASGRRYL